MHEGLNQLGEFLAKSEGGQRPDHKYTQRAGNPGNYQYTYAPQGDGQSQPIAQTDTGEPVHAVERGPHSVNAWGEVLVGKTTPGHEQAAPRHIEHDGKHWIRAGYNTDSNTVGYHEYQPARHLMDPTTGFAREAVPVDAKGVAGGLFHVAGLPEHGGGDLPQEINDPHHGKLTVRGFNSDSGMTLYHKDVHNPGWNKPGSTGEAKAGATPPGANASPQSGQNNPVPAPIRGNLPQGGQPPAPQPGQPTAGGQGVQPPMPPTTSPQPAPKPPLPGGPGAPQAQATGTNLPPQPSIPGKTPQTPLVGQGQPPRPPVAGSPQAQPTGQPGAQALPPKPPMMNPALPAATPKPGTFPAGPASQTSSTMPPPPPRTVGATQPPPATAQAPIPGGVRPPMKPVMGGVPNVPPPAAPPLQGAAPKPPVPGVPPAPPVKPAVGGKKNPFQKSGLDVLGDWMEKALGGEREGHKYIKREGAPGAYHYTYRPGHSYTLAALREQTQGASAKQHLNWALDADKGGDPKLGQAHRELASHAQTGHDSFLNAAGRALAEHRMDTRARSGDTVHHEALGASDKYGANKWVVHEHPKGADPIMRAGQSTREGAEKYMKPGRSLSRVREDGTLETVIPHTNESTKKMGKVAKQGADKAQDEHAGRRFLDVKHVDIHDHGDHYTVHLPAEYLGHAVTKQKFNTSGDAQDAAQNIFRNATVSVTPHSTPFSKPKESDRNPAKLTHEINHGPEEWHKEEAEATAAHAKAKLAKYGDRTDLSQDEWKDNFQHHFRAAAAHRRLADLTPTDRSVEHRKMSDYHSNLGMIASGEHSRLQGKSGPSKTPKAVPSKKAAKPAQLKLFGKSLDGLNALGDFLQKADKIPGGLADDKSPKDFDPEALAQGVKVEREHTSDPSIAREIAMDHLTEDPSYYTKLEKIEKCGMNKASPTKGATEKCMNKAMTGLEALGSYLHKSLEDPMPDEKCELSYDKSKEIGESPDGGDLNGKRTPEFKGDRVGDAHEGSGGQPGTADIGAPALAKTVKAGKSNGEKLDVGGDPSVAKSVKEGTGAGTPEDVGGSPSLRTEAINDEERAPEDQMSDGKSTLEDDVREKSLTPAGQRSMVARDHALKVQELTKSHDVRVGAPDHPYMMSAEGDVNEQAERLTKGEFYHGNSPSLGQPNTILRKSVLCKSEACGVSYPAFYTSCPECGEGQTVNRLLPHGGHMGGADHGAILEKSSNDPILRPIPEEPDVMVGAPDNVVLFRTRR